MILSLRAKFKPAFLVIASECNERGGANKVVFCESKKCVTSAPREVKSINSKYGLPHFKFYGLPRKA